MDLQKAKCSCLPTESRGDPDNESLASQDFRQVDFVARRALHKLDIWEAIADFDVCTSCGVEV